MFAYRIRSRGILHKGGPPLAFPNPCRLEVELSPKDLFGGVVGSSNLLNRASLSHVQVGVDPSKGTASFGGAIPFPRVAFERIADGVHIRCEGSTISFEFQCERREDLLLPAANIYLWLCPIMSLLLQSAVVIDSVTGRLGDTVFEMIVPRVTLSSFEVVTGEEQTRKVAVCVDLLLRLHCDPNPRLCAAMSYFHTARRLICMGETRFEFLSEAILNLTKSLEALFGNKTDDWRAELGKLGFERDWIEQRAIPIHAARNDLDVGHCSLTPATPFEVDVLETYGDIAVHSVQAVLQAVVFAGLSGDYPLPPAEIGNDRERRRRINRIYSYIPKNRRPPAPDSDPSGAGTEHG